jgi:hypothetical protein
MPYAPRSLTKCPALPGRNTPSGDPSSKYDKVCQPTSHTHSGSAPFVPVMQVSTPWHTCINSLHWMCNICLYPPFADTPCRTCLQHAESEHVGDRSIFPHNLTDLEIFVASGCNFCRFTYNWTRVTHERVHQSCLTSAKDQVQNLVLTTFNDGYSQVSTMSPWHLILEYPGPSSEEKHK